MRRDAADAIEDDGMGTLDGRVAVVSRASVGRYERAAGLIPGWVIGRPSPTPSREG